VKDDNQVAATPAVLFMPVMLASSSGSDYLAKVDTASSDKFLFVHRPPNDLR
jgi:hypothetical protein